MTKLDGLGESELLRRILPYIAAEGLEIAAGEDDAASWGEGAGFTVASCDISVEGAMGVRPGGLDLVRAESVEGDCLRATLLRS